MGSTGGSGFSSGPSFGLVRSEGVSYTERILLGTSEGFTRCAQETDGHRNKKYNLEVRGESKGLMSPSRLFPDQYPCRPHLSVQSPPFRLRVGSARRTLVTPGQGGPEDPGKCGVGDEDVISVSSRHESLPSLRSSGPLLYPLFYVPKVIRVRVQFPGRCDRTQSKVVDRTFV